VSIGMHARHAEALLPSLDFLLRHERIERSAIRGVVVGNGPGSFTGVRIAAATARGLALGLGVPLYAFSTLAALALDLAAVRPVCALLDARRGEVYAALYGRVRKDVLEEILPAAALPLTTLLTLVREHAPLYAGPGAERYAAELPEPPLPAWPRASALLRLAAADPGAGRVRDLAAWEPSYLRASGAERGIAG
jgi:tRNA threonylcarbamoyladenosine biosynthesis protein TsaB